MTPSSSLACKDFHCQQLYRELDVRFYVANLVLYYTNNRKMALVKGSLCFREIASGRIIVNCFTKLSLKIEKLQYKQIHTVYFYFNLKPIAHFLVLIETAHGKVRKNRKCLLYSQSRAVLGYLARVYTHCVQPELDQGCCGCVRRNLFCTRTFVLQKKQIFLKLFLSRIALIKS